MTAKTKAQKYDEQIRKNMRVGERERAEGALKIGDGSGVGASRFKATIEFSYLDFQNFASFPPAELHERLGALQKEARSRLGLMWSSQPEFAFSDGRGVAHTFSIFCKGYEISSVNAHLKLTDVYEERREVFRDIVARANMLTAGGHPCMECGVDSVARASVGDLCDTHWDEYFAKASGQRVPYSQRCCEKAYNVFCVCVNKRYCPDHGSSCMGSHD